MDEGKQEKQVSIMPLWNDTYKNVHDGLLRIQTELETAVNLNKTPEADVLARFIGALYGELNTMMELLDIFVKSIGLLQKQHAIVHDESTQMRSDFAIYVKTTEKALAAFNAFVAEYGSMLQELAIERAIRNRATPPPSPQQGGQRQS